MDKKEQALQKHFEWKGKIQIQSRVPVSNSETYVGQRIALTAVKADDRWYDMPECYECWNEVMVSADYRNAKPEVKFW